MTEQKSTDDFGDGFRVPLGIKNRNTPNVDTLFEMLQTDGRPFEPYQPAQFGEWAREEHSGNPAPIKSVRPAQEAIFDDLANKDFGKLAEHLDDLWRSGRKSRQKRDWEAIAEKRALEAQHGSKVKTDTISAFTKEMARLAGASGAAKTEKTGFT